MKRLMLTGALVLATGTTGFGDALHWVVGNRATGKCDIVTSNPIVFGFSAYDSGGAYTVWFGDGPYKSRADARLARSTIFACPPQPDEPDGK